MIGYESQTLSGTLAHLNPRERTLFGGLRAAFRRLIARLGWSAGSAPEPVLQSMDGGTGSEEGGPSGPPKA